MEIRNSPDVEVVKDAERILYREKWRICEERAAEQLAGTRALKWIRLFPESTVVWVVALDGVVIGRLRRDAGRWIATGMGKRGPVADRGTFRAALRALRAKHGGHERQRKPPRRELVGKGECHLRCRISRGMTSTEA